MKTWNVGLATAAIGFVAAKDAKPAAAVYCLAPALAFWFLDAYYLALDLRFRPRDRPDPMPLPCAAVHSGPGPKGMPNRATVVLRCSW